MKKVIIADFVEYNSPSARLGNYHYCKCFINDGYEALWMSNAFNQLIYLKDKQDYLFKKSISTGQRHPLGSNVYGFAPYSLRLYGNYPFSKSPRIIERFEKYIIPDIAESFKKMDFFNVDVLWISNPKMYWLSNVLQYNKLVYRMADDYSQFAEFPNISGIDAKLINKADQVVIASSIYARHVLERGRTPLLLNNGVEYEHFSRSGLDFPVEYEGNKRRKIVYVGALKYWFDTELMVKLALEVDADIFIIGKCDTDLSALQKLPNVHIIGARNYDLLPAYLQYADVGLIPFIKSQATDGVSPIKLYEYCSAGLAVVSTNLTETVNINAPIWIADNHNTFIDGVKHYLTNGYDRQVLMDFGKNNSWRQRYELLQQKL